MAKTIDQLTARQTEVLTLLALGLTGKEVGARLFISTQTVKNHVTTILRDLECATTREAAYRYGLWRAGAPLADRPSVAELPLVEQLRIATAQMRAEATRAA